MKTPRSHRPAAADHWPSYRTPAPAVPVRGKFELLLGLPPRPARQVVPLRPLGAEQPLRA